MSDARPEDGPGNAGYDEWLTAVEEGDGYYLECPESHGSLPPRRVCPDCGSTELTEEPLPETGVLETYSQTHVPIPAFDEDAPYVVAIATFGPVSITGQLPDVDPDVVEVGSTVEVDIARRQTTGDPLVVFRLR